MKPLYTKAEFKTAKSRQLLPFRCLHCNKIFHKTKNFIQVVMAKRTKEHTINFCSHLCHSIHRNTHVLLSCEQCGKPFKKLPCQIRRTKHHFCSCSCAIKYIDAHRTKGTHVSKLERWLQSKLISLYPTLEFHFNRTDAINGELDIYIPSLKLAFELNGIFHYEPIYGSEKFTQTQNNDHRKMLACSECGVELCVIDVSRQKYFKEQSSIEFLSIVKNIIDSKLSRHPSFH